MVRPSSCALDTEMLTEVLIGNSAHNAYFNGLIDEVRIYNRALTADEIKVLSQLPGPKPNGNWMKPSGHNGFRQRTLGYPGSIAEYGRQTKWVKGVFGNALNFDGVDEYVTVTGYKGISGSKCANLCGVDQDDFEHRTDRVLGRYASMTGGMWELRVNSPRAIAGADNRRRRGQ